MVISDNASFNLDVAEAAVANWKSNKKKRDRGLKAHQKGEYDKVETAERLAKRYNHLIDQVKRTAADMATVPAALRELMGKDPIKADEIDNRQFERVLGLTRDFLSVEFIPLAARSIRPVGRVLVAQQTNQASVGTGFMVSPTLMLTNHHVLPSGEMAEKSEVEFDFQLDIAGQPMQPHRFKLNPDSFFHANQTLDYALVAVDETPPRDKPLSAFGHLFLNPQTGKVTIGEPLNIVQHPRGGMKRIVIRENQLQDLPDDPHFAAHYVGDTEPGSSGAPVFSDRWEVVALHHAGVWDQDEKGNILDIEGNVWDKETDDPARIKWVANEGIRISRLVANVRNEVKDPARRALLQSVFDGIVLPSGNTTVVMNGGLNGGQPAHSQHQTTNGATTVQTGQTGNTVSITLPVTITVSVGTPNGAHGEAVVATNTAVSEPDRPEEPTDLEEPDGLGPFAQEKHLVKPTIALLNARQGYDPDFLGFHVPMPRLPDHLLEQARVQRNSDEIELKYLHFSTVMNGPRKLAFFSAGNYDVNAPVQHNRVDAFLSDPRVKRGLQATGRFYSSNPLDRGHLFRREAGAWGANETIARTGNDDTYFWTNISPQNSFFNQSSMATKEGLMLWGNLENLIGEEAESEHQRISIFCGPVFRDDDRLHRGLGIPREYWKIVIFESDDGAPAAACFRLSQAELISDLPAEEFNFTQFATFQEPISAIARDTELDFGEVARFDVLGENGSGRQESMASNRIRIDSARKIKLKR